MIYNGLGNGNAIERNKQRIEYVTKLSKDACMIENLIDNIYKNIEINDFCNVKENLKILFFENIPNNIIVQMCNIHNILEYESTQLAKHKIIHRCCNQAKKGFIWNMFDVYIKLNESVLA